MTSSYTPASPAPSAPSIDYICKAIAEGQEIQGHRVGAGRGAFRAQVPAAFAGEEVRVGGLVGFGRKVCDFRPCGGLFAPDVRLRWPSVSI